MIFAARTAVINLAITLTTFLVIFKFKPRNLIILLLLSLLPLYSLLNKGVYESGDLAINVFKSMEFYTSLSEGNIFPGWAGRLNAAYGYPLFNFTYPLP
ncbi:MAG: putative membrane spanning protein [Microgenomates group bacterium Gr01-1014_16]|nr:MAG: putative membrane spanning protein [Microgenomates group bacterium Gr01-1014_16]